MHPRLLYIICMSIQFTVTIIFQHNPLVTHSLFESRNKTSIFKASYIVHIADIQYSNAFFFFHFNVVWCLVCVFTVYRKIYTLFSFFLIRKYIIIFKKSQEHFQIIHFMLDGNGNWDRYLFTHLDLNLPLHLTKKKRGNTFCLNLTRLFCYVSHNYVQNEGGGCLNIHLKINSEIRFGLGKERWKMIHWYVEWFIWIYGMLFYQFVLMCIYTLKLNYWQILDEQKLIDWIYRHFIKQSVEWNIIC